MSMSPRAASVRGQLDMEVALFHCHAAGRVAKWLGDIHWHSCADDSERRRAAREGGSLLCATYTALAARTQDVRRAPPSHGAAKY